VDFTIEFVLVFARGLFLGAPILLFLMAVVAVVGQIIGRGEGWSRSDALYYAFITATTVGYGDFHPSRRSGKYLAIIIALVGLLLTAIVAAIGVKAAEIAFRHTALA